MSDKEDEQDKRHAEGSDVGGQAETTESSAEDSLIDDDPDDQALNPA